MPKYRIYLVATATTSQIVEADSIEDAYDAEFKHPGSLCHQCSRTFDLGDFEMDEDVEEMEP